MIMRYACGSRRLLIIAMVTLCGFIAGCKKTWVIGPSGKTPGHSAAAPLPQPACIAYVEVNDNSLHNIGCYLLSNGQPAVNVANIFAGNINYAPGNGKPVVSLNPQTSYLLDKTSYVKDLQAKGIRVTLSLLNNHDGSGWSQFKTEEEADYFAKSVAATIKKYGLDGIDIDDEYADAIGNSQSIPMAVAAIRKLLPDIIIGFYIYSDSGIDPGATIAYKYPDNTRFSDLITYAIGNFGDNLESYEGDIAKTKLFYESSAYDIGENAAGAKQNGYGGVMLFNANDHSQDALTAMAKAYYGSESAVSVAADCMQPGGGASEPGSPEHTYIIP